MTTISQRIYSGRFSNRTKRHILKESALIQVFKNIRISLEQMFALENRTFKHSPAKMQHTFRKLGIFMRKVQTHVRVPGRRSAYTIPDVMEAGLVKLMSSEFGEYGLDEVQVPDAGVGDEVDAENGDLDV